MIFSLNTTFPLGTLWMSWSKLKLRSLLVLPSMLWTKCLTTSRTQWFKSKSLMMISSRDKRMNVIQRLASEMVKSKRVQRSSVFPPTNWTFVLSKDQRLKLSMVWLKTNSPWMNNTLVLSKTSERLNKKFLTKWP